MREAQFQTEFKKRNQIHGCFELKLCKGTSLSFSSIKEHQKQALLDISSNIGLYWKIADAPFFKDEKARMRFTKPKPFDSFLLKDISAYIVVMFYTPRKKKNVIYIDIERFIRMEEETTRKSFTEQMAIDYSAFSFNYLQVAGKTNQRAV